MNDVELVFHIVLLHVLHSNASCISAQADAPSDLILRTHPSSAARLINSEQAISQLPASARTITCYLSFGFSFLQSQVSAEFFMVSQIQTVCDWMLSGISAFFALLNVACRFIDRP